MYQYMSPIIAAGEDCLVHKSSVTSHSLVWPDTLYGWERYRTVAGDSQIYNGKKNPQID